MPCFLYSFPPRVRTRTETPSDSTGPASASASEERNGWPWEFQKALKPATGQSHRRTSLPCHWPCAEEFLVVLPASCVLRNTGWQLSKKSHWDMRHKRACITRFCIEGVCVCLRERAHACACVRVRMCVGASRRDDPPRLGCALLGHAGMLYTFMVGLGLGRQRI